jgi:lysophospholipase L1-like esterase
VITNPAATTVLCFGDSNTYGDRPDDVEPSRWPPDVRWTGRLQALLGESHYVIEEGLGGRTTDLDYDDRPGRNGRAYFVPCLLSHTPIDTVVIMLGTNDLKTEFARTPAQIANALEGFVDDVAQFAQRRDGGVPRVVIMSPIHIDESRPLFGELCLPEYGPGSAARSRQLAGELRRVADARGALFVDAASVAEAGDDGVHLTLESHPRLAELVAATLSETSSE